MTRIIDHTEHRANAVKACVSLLNARLAEAIDLSLMAKQAHWNLKGSNFFSLHRMFDDIREQMDDQVDALAERAVQLGGEALGTSQAVSAGTSLTAYPTTIRTEREHLAAFGERLGTAGDKARTSIGEAAESGDAGTADILTGYSLTLEKSLWFVNSHTGDH
jgi:starvation-inducible DNA-binding protein